MSRIGTVSIAVIFLVLALLAPGTIVYFAHSPVEIRDWFDLDAVRNNLQASYVLMNDLNCTTPGYQELAGPAANEGYGWEQIGTSLRPLGTAVERNSFSGTFDGQGYEIRDLYVNRPREVGSGLFGGVGLGGVVKDIRVVNATVTGAGFVGLFAELGAGGRVEGINVVNSTVSADGFVGGLVGVDLGTVTSSHFAGTVSGTQTVGGLVGFNGGIVSDSCFTGSVTGNGTTGGLVGSNSQGTLSSSYSTGSVSGSDGVGGLVGINAQGTMSNCYSTGSVTGGNFTGGLVGNNDRGTISNCYSTGSVTGGDFTGGLIGGQFFSGTVTNSFWNTETSGQVTSAGGAGKTTAEMQNIDTFSSAGWSVTGVANLSTRNPSYIWNIAYQVISHLQVASYPFLSWYPRCPQGQVSPIQIQTASVPSGYFRFTVSPADICAYVGDQIEIGCTTDVVVNTLIDIDSIDVVLLDSRDRMLREQTMTKDYSWWHANTVYRIVGDEAYYRIKITFTVISLSGSGEYTTSGDYTEYGEYSFPISIRVGATPIEIMSTVGPIAPYNWAGPVVDTTVRDVATEPVVSLTATLEIASGLNTLFDIAFNVTPANPLQPGASTSAKCTLIGGGISRGECYPLTIHATLQNGAKFVYTKLVQIAGP